MKTQVKIYATRNPPEWHYIGTAKNFIQANKTEAALAAQGYYTKRESKESEENQNENL